MRCRWAKIRMRRSRVAEAARRPLCRIRIMVARPVASTAATKATVAPTVGAAGFFPVPFLVIVYPMLFVVLTARARRHDAAPPAQSRPDQDAHAAEPGAA